MIAFSGRKEGARFKLRSIFHTVGSVRPQLISTVCPLTFPLEKAGSEAARLDRRDCPQIP